MCCEHLLHGQHIIQGCNVWCMFLKLGSFYLFFSRSWNADHRSKTHSCNMITPSLKTRRKEMKRKKKSSSYRCFLGRTDDYFLARHLPWWKAAMSQQADHSPTVIHFWILGSCTFICVGELSNSFPSPILEKQNKTVKQRGEAVLGVGKCFMIQVSTCYQVIPRVTVTHWLGIWNVFSMEALL